MVGEYLKSWSKPDVPLLMEGNTVARYLKPQLRLFVVNPSLSRSAWKEGSEEFLHEADWVIVNRDPVGTPTDPDTKSISVLLDGVRKKCVEGLPDPLNQWQDLKLYQTIAGFLNESG